MKKFKLAKKNKIIYSVLFLLFFLLLHWLKLLSPVENFFVKSISSVGKKIYSINTLFSGKNEINEDELSENNKFLKSEKEKLRLLTETSRLKMIEEENSKLRKILDLSEKSNFELITSRVLANNLYDTSGSYFSGRIIVDKGSEKGIEEGQVVLNEDGSVIGKVLAVKKHLSQICLITNDSCRLAVAIQNSNKTIGVVQGNMDLTLKMDFIPQTEKITQGDIVVTSGLEPLVPSGIFVGVVEEMKKNNNDLWQMAIIKTFFNTNDLKIISIVLPEKNSFYDP
jgi:rod shape-determining protein MreC